jgi:hypothetical protein
MLSVTIKYIMLSVVILNVYYAERRGAAMSAQFHG